MSPPGEETVRVVTWNVHGGVGRDGRCDLARTADLLLALAPDVAALQEVDGRRWLGREPAAFERLAALLGGHVAEARLTGRGSGAYGHLLWSRRPIRRARVRPLPGGLVEPRAAIDAAVETPFGPLRVLACHFGLGPRDRRRQADFVAALAADEGEPTVALGDFNDWRGAGGAVHRALAPALPNVALAPTWPARRPLARLDRIYASAAVRIVARRAAGEAGAASDHLPLVADLRVCPPAPIG
jgi:endonuclease/exonuclease/phosphatase family metal-dependent hydrolase